MRERALREAIDVYKELLRTHQLNIELLNTLELSLFCIRDFCQKNNIPFEDRKLSQLIGKIDVLLCEISAPYSTSSKNIRRFFIRRKSDKDLTEPYFDPLWAMKP